MNGANAARFMPPSYNFAGAALLVATKTPPYSKTFSKTLLNTSASATSLSSTSSKHTRGERTTISFATSASGSRRGSFSLTMFSFLSLSFSSRGDASREKDDPSGAKRTRVWCVDFVSAWSRACTSAMNAWKCTRRALRLTCSGSVAKNASMSMVLPRPTPPCRYTPCDLSWEKTKPPTASVPSPVTGLARHSACSRPRRAPRGSANRVRRSWRLSSASTCLASARNDPSRTRRRYHRSGPSSSSPELGADRREASGTRLSGSGTRAPAPRSAAEPRAKCSRAADARPASPDATRRAMRMDVLLFATGSRELAKWLQMDRMCIVQRLSICACPRRKIQTECLSIFRRV